MVKTVNEIAKAVDSSALLDRPIPNWRNVLAEECGVYVFGENYIAKRFDQINYVFCDKFGAKDIVVDNLYALLRYKYFPKSTEDIDKRIQEIVNNFTLNLKTTLKKVAIEEDSNCCKVSYLPDGCVAFRNGVYNFKTNNWLFKYDITYVDLLHNTIYQYDPKWIITWYININFEPLPIDINEIDLKDFINLMKDLTKSDKNYCFELLYNMAHDINDNFSYQKFVHLCEILGYTLQISFNQNFVMLVGNGGNGKNSLFDGCFINRVIPTPASNALESFETDRFITGALENKAHNIYLETSQKTLSFDTQVFKNITGSMYQTIESKGVQKYSSIINCKNIFSANDQDKLKFTDTTQGFRRRINVYEIWYSWDAQKRFLKHGDYYDTTFSDSLKEVKENISNLVAYIYFGMYGLKIATKDFTNNFKFSNNDWKLTYTDLDMDLKEKIDSLTLSKIIRVLEKTKSEDYKVFLYSLDKKRLYESKWLKDLGYKTYEDLIKFLNNDEYAESYFAENDIYINLRILQKICNDTSPALTFTKNLKKIFNFKNTVNIYNNQAYAKARFINGRLVLIN